MVKEPKSKSDLKIRSSITQTGLICALKFSATQKSREKKILRNSVGIVTSRLNASFYFSVTAKNQLQTVTLLMKGNQ